MPPSLSGLVERLRTLPSPAVARERLAERTGHAVASSHRPHLEAALDWLVRAQDATPDDGFSRGYSLTWHRHFRSRGWQPSYPETTGYIIPTLYMAARAVDRPDLADRATRAAAWESEIQMETGAVQGGVIGEARSPAIFNTGQVLFGWLAALEETGEHRFEASARKAASWLASITEADGRMRAGNSRFADPKTTLYNARTAWALAEAGARLGESSWTDAASRALRHVASRQASNGWLPDCCLFDADRPLLHTLAYATRGLLEGGRVLEDDRLLAAATRGAEALLTTVDGAGKMPGQLAADWSGACTWSCLTGQAQAANIWLRLHRITGEATWLEPVPRVLRFLEATQNRTSRDEGLRGGIKGSAPISGLYGRYEILNWATKFFADAILRWERSGSATSEPMDALA